MTSILLGGGIGCEVREYVASRYRVAIKALREFNDAFDALTIEERRQFSTLNRHAERMEEAATEMFGRQVSMFEGV